MAFLDDDDLVEPDHFEVLLGMAQGTGSRVCYSDAAVGVYEATEQGWSRVERRLPYSRDFDPERLAVDNYIPFNTVLIERALALEVGPVDEALPCAAAMCFVPTARPQQSDQSCRQAAE